MADIGLMEALQFIALVGAVGAVIYKVVRPIMNNSKDIKELKSDVAELKEHQEQYKVALEEIGDTSKDTMKMVLAMLNHSIDGNGIETMKELRDDMIDKL